MFIDYFIFVYFLKMILKTFLIFSHLSFLVIYFTFSSHISLTHLPLLPTISFSILYDISLLLLFTFKMNIVVNFTQFLFCISLFIKYHKEPKLIKCFWLDKITSHCLRIEKMIVYIQPSYTSIYKKKHSFKG